MIRLWNSKRIKLILGNARGRSRVSVTEKLKFFWVFLLKRLKKVTISLLWLVWLELLVTGAGLLIPKRSSMFAGFEVTLPLFIIGLTGFCCCWGGTWWFVCEIPKGLNSFWVTPVEGAVCPLPKNWNFFERIKLYNYNVINKFKIYLFQQKYNQSLNFFLIFG